jgi:hypothetical protein
MYKACGADKQREAGPGKLRKAENYREGALFS